MTAFVVEIARGRGPLRATGVDDPRSRSWVAGDIRLDDRETLLARLSAAGHAPPHAAGDAGLVLAAFTAWGERAPERLIGAYAFAAWDATRGVLLCARDGLGIRSLFWGEFAGAFVCSNELDAVRGHPAAGARLHEPAIASFLENGFNTDLTTTTWADVRRLAPGHQLLVRADGGVDAPRRHWSFPVPEPLRLARDDEYVERFRDVLGRAVADRLRGPSAAILLSGGLDSTSLAATARRVAPSVTLSAWTTDRSEAVPNDDARLAALVASRLGLAHHLDREMTVPFAHLDRPGFRTPEPLDEPEWGEWIALLTRIAAETGTLVMGEDGDALLSPSGLFGMLRTWPMYDVLRRVMRYTFTSGHLPYLGFWLRRRLAAPFRRQVDAAPRFIRAEFLARAAAPPELAIVPHPSRPEAHRQLADPVWQGVLEPAQRSYTGVALDQVWPLLDPRVLEFAFSIPPVPWCQRKELLRRAFAAELPPEVIARPKTSLPGYYEWQVATWRAARRPDDIRFGERVRDFVDTSVVVSTLKTGSVVEVCAAWRVLVLDQWLRSVE